VAKLIEGEDVLELRSVSAALAVIAWVATACTSASSTCGDAIGANSPSLK
jgi:hypothetical protein